MIFVFGSNLRGVHGAGAAKYALENLGAQWGVGEGLTGQCYALPTKDFRIMSLPLKDIKYYVDQFIRCAEMHPELQFKVTQIGCGYAGFKSEQIAPMFINAPDNCWFDIAWKDLINTDKDFSYKFWN